MNEKCIAFTKGGLKRFIERTAKLIDKKIDEIPVIDSIYDDLDSLEPEEQERFVVRTIKKVW